MKLKKKNKLVCGVGLNDLQRQVYRKVDGKTVICPIYKTWKSMLVRCYDPNYHHRATYDDCWVSQDWLRLSNFEKWMLKQDWEGKELDKDILSPGSKIYAEDTCVFVSHDVNVFLIDSGAARGKQPLGVSWDDSTKKFAAQCNNPFTKKREHIGLFECPNDAHLAWKARKHQHALVYADQQTDPRVAEALRIRYL